jgi:hypothetical protein
MKGYAVAAARVRVFFPFLEKSHTYFLIENNELALVSNC